MSVCVGTENAEEIRQSDENKQTMIDSITTRCSIPCAVCRSGNVVVRVMFFMLL